MIKEADAAVLANSEQPNYGFCPILTDSKTGVRRGVRLDTRDS